MAFRSPNTSNIIWNASGSGQQVSYIEGPYQYVLEIMAKCVEKISGKITSISPREQPRVSRSPEWYIRIHFPYRITQLGAPLLILAVLDKRMAESLILQGKLEKSLADEDLLWIWESTRLKINSLFRTPEDASELRLHLPSSIFKKVGLNDCTIQAQFWATFRPKKSGPEWQGPELLGLNVVLVNFALKKQCFLSFEKDKIRYR